MRRAATYLALLTVLWAMDAALGTGVFWHHDLRTHHMPWRVWAASEWLEGRVPLWSPEVGAGFPLMADGQTGVFYAPTMLLFMVLPPALALNWSILLHIWWAGLGTFLFVRSLGHRELSSFFAAVAFAFSGFMATHTLYLGMQNAAAWLPWVLWALRRERRAMAALSVFMLLVAGHIQIAVFSLMPVVVLGLAWRRYALLALSLGLGIAAASPQLIATWELSQHGLRAGGVDAAFAGVGSLPPQELLNGVLPKLFGFDRPADVAQSYFHRGPGYWGQGVNHWETAFYLGIPTVFFAVFARGRGLWWVICGVCVVLMLGAHTPLWLLLRELPGMSGFRFPVRFSLPLTLCVAVLAAGGLDRILDTPRAQLARWSRYTLAAAAVLVVGAVVANEARRALEPTLERQLVSWFVDKQAQHPGPPPGLEGLAAFVMPGPEPISRTEVGAHVEMILASLERSTSLASLQLLVPVACLFVLGLALAALARGQLAPYGFGLGAAAVLATDLFWFGSSYNPRVPRRFVESTPSALSVIADEPGRYRTTAVDRRQRPGLDIELMSASLGLLYGTRDVIITSPLLLLRNEAYLAKIGLDVGDRGPEKVSRLLDHKHLVDLLGVRFLLSVHDITGPGIVRLLRGEVSLYENSQAMPPVFVLGCVQQPDEPWVALDELDQRAWALVESDVDVPACFDGAGAGRAWIVDDDPQRMVIHADVTADRALLVQTDTWYPGWEAAVDGQPVPLHRADFLFRGVVLPEGSHEVVLRYRPTAIHIGIVLLVLGVVCIVGIAAHDVRGRGRTESTQ